MTDPGKNNTKDKLLSVATAEIVPLPVRPLVSPEQAARAWKLFLDLKKKLLDEHDYQLIVGKQHIKKSGFRKLAVVFNLWDRILEQERTEREDGTFTWRIVVEVQAPNGRICTGVAVCDSRERKFAHVEHDVYATAHTRAKNRGISDMVAGGVVSAEEMLSTPQEETPKPEEKKNPLAEVVLKKGQTWDKIFKKFGPEIQTRQEELGPLFSFEQAAIVFGQEKGFVQELPR